MNRISARRRTVLRGMLGGGLVTVALPFLDCFLNENGDALAATGAPLPNRFGTWFWGCGLGPGTWEPKTTGADYEMPAHLAALAPYRKHVTIFSGLKAVLDGSPLQPHASGARAVFIGTVGKESDPSLDVLVADAIGSTTRFRSLEVSALGYPSNTQSRRSPTAVNAAEGSPVALYERLFGPEFQDPNAAEFTPDPRVMMRKSVLSVVKDQRDTLSQKIGAADRARLDEYYTSLRQIEQEMELQLTKPAKLEACTVPPKSDAAAGSTDVDIASANHKVFVKLLAHAIACDQTRVINLTFTDGLSSLRRKGHAETHHIFTHEEPVDTKLGYQPNVYYFEERILQGLAALPEALSAIREGDGTLLDRTLILAGSECGFAKFHALDNIPILLIGGAGGRLKTGHHISVVGDSVTRVGLTVQQALGMSVDSWGRSSMRTSRGFSELIA
jgi:hypothetical protein